MSRAVEPEHAVPAPSDREERTRILSELTSDYAYSARVGADGTPVSEWITDAFTRVTGYTAEELRDRAAWERLLHPDDLPAVIHHFAVLLSGKPHACEYRIITRAGDVRWIYDRGHPAWDGSKSRVSRVYGAAQDITGRKHAELERDATLEALRNSEALFRCTFEAIPDAAILWHRQADGCVTLARYNAAAVELSRGRIADLVDIEVDRFFDHSPAVAARIHHTMETGETQRVEVFYHLRTTGEQKWLLADYVRVTPDYVLNIIQDITARKEAEQRLEQQARKLQARNEELDAFAHTVAHDVKHPLTLMVNFADLLIERYDGVAREKALRYLDAIARNGRKMSQIIGDLLLLSRVPHDDVPREPLDMAHAVSEARGRLAGLIEAHQAEIVAPDAWPLAVGYAPWVEIVWSNYLSNAIQYGGLPPRIELGATAQDDGTIRFWVRDNGPGLAPQEQAQLFAPFTQLDSDRTRGHGLGLSIVKRIVTKLGGQVGVESEGLPGEGCIFFFTLPEYRGNSREDERQV